MEWLIVLVLLGLAFMFLGVPMLTGLVAIFATPSAPSKKQRAARIESAPEVLADVFDGSLNATFVRDLHEPITETMLMDAANRASYALVSRDNAAGRITYRFTRH